MVNGLHLYLYILGVRCLAQGHFDTPRVGSNRQPSDCQTTALPPEPYRCDTEKLQSRSQSDSFQKEWHNELKPVCTFPHSWSHQFGQYPQHHWHVRRRVGERWKNTVCEVKSLILPFLQESVWFGTVLFFSVTMIPRTLLMQWNHIWRVKPLIKYWQS